MLLLRTCDEEGRSCGGRYQYPGVGEVAVAEDWDPTPECGGGLHGLPNGQGYGGLLDWGDRALWQVLDTEDAPVVEFERKAKCQSAREVYRGDRAGALAYLREHGVTDPLPGDLVDVGDHGVAAVGYKGRATAGACGYATAGACGHATAGDRGHATVGDGGHATVGIRGTATAGDRGKATAGWSSKAQAGDCGAAQAGCRGKARAGNRGVITIDWWDSAAARLRHTVGYVGEDGIEADTWYECNEDGQLVAVEEVTSEDHG